MPKPSATTTKPRRRRQRSSVARLPEHIDPKVLAAQQGVKPIGDYRKLVEEFRDLWPNDEEIDAFVAWVRRERREGGRPRRLL